MDKYKFSLLFIQYFTLRNFLINLFFWRWSNKIYFLSLQLRNWPKNLSKSSGRIALPAKSTTNGERSPIWENYIRSGRTPEPSFIWQTLFIRTSSTRSTSERMPTKNFFRVKRFRWSGRKTDSFASNANRAGSRSGSFTTAPRRWWQRATFLTASCLSTEIENSFSCRVKNASHSGQKWLKIRDSDLLK